MSPLGRITATDVSLLLTRQNPQNSIDIFGYREKAPVSHIMDNVRNALDGLQLPAGYRISQEGDAKQAAESSDCLLVAMAIGRVLLYFSRVPAFRSSLPTR